MQQDDFVRLAVAKGTRRKTALLAKALGMTIYDLVEEWAMREWTEQKHEGLVTDAMLEPRAVKEPA